MYEKRYYIMKIFNIKKKRTKENYIILHESFQINYTIKQDFNK